MAHRIAGVGAAQLDVGAADGLAADPEAELAFGADVATELGADAAVQDIEAARAEAGDGGVGIGVAEVDVAGDRRHGGGLGEGGGGNGHGGGRRRGGDKRLHVVVFLTALSQPWLGGCS